MKITIDTAQQKLIEFRQEKGFTLEKMSEQTSVAKSTLIAIEAGRVKPQAMTIYRINQFLEKYNEMV